MSHRPEVLERWHRIIETRDLADLARLLADDATFRSPAVHTPVVGRDAVMAYLAAAFTVLGPTLAYQREWADDGSAVLEFTAVIGDDVRVHGVDVLTWGDGGQLTGVTVMVRPLKALNTLVGLMGAELATQQGGARPRVRGEQERPRQDSNLRPRD